MNSDFTRKFQVVQDRSSEMKAILTTVYDALKEKGYNPINQIVGYILSEDPTYITNYNGARTLIRKLDRDEWESACYARACRASASCRLMQSQTRLRRYKKLFKLFY